MNALPDFDVTKGVVVGEGESADTEIGDDAPNPATNFRAEALALAAEGFRLIPPLPPGAKQANTPGWPALATSDPEQVSRWYPQGERALFNVGIATGDGLLVLDEDPKNNSDASVAALQLKHGPLPATRTARTPSGGKHRYFRVPADRYVPNSTSKLGPGLDIRGEHGYVAAPPSRTAVGEYRWDDPATSIADAPAWLVELATTPRKPKAPNGSGSGTESVEVPKHDLTLADAREMLSYLSAERDDYESWAEVLWALNRMAKGAQDGSTESDWIALGDEWSAKSPKYASREDVVEKWREADARPGYGTKHLIELAKAQGYAPPARSRVSSPSDFNDPGEVPSNVSQVVGPADAAPKLPTLTLRTLRDDLYTNPPPPRPKTLGGYLPKGAASKFGGPGGMGKSMVALYGASCVATGNPFCGQPCTAGVVVYLSAEDDFAEFERRMHNILHALYPSGLPDDVRALLKKNLIVIDLVESGTEALLTQMDRRGKVAITPFADHVATVLAGLSPELVIFDTQSRFHGGPENDNTAGAVFIRALERVAKKTGAAVKALSHVGKGKDTDGSQYDRGASALTDNSRAAMKLVLPPPGLESKLADPRQIEALKRENIVRLVHAKNSYGRRFDDVYFERLPDTGVLLPVMLTYETANGPSPFPPSESDHLSYLLSEMAKAPDDPEQEFREISRGELKREWKKWCGPTASREEAETAFLTAVNTKQLVFSRKVSNARWYRLAPKSTDTSPATTGGDLF